MVCTADVTEYWSSLYFQKIVLLLLVTTNPIFIAYCRQIIQLISLMRLFHFQTHTYLVLVNVKMQNITLLYTDRKIKVELGAN